MRDEDTPPSHPPPTPTTTHELPSPPKGSRDVHPGIPTIVNRSDFEFVSARKIAKDWPMGLLGRTARQVAYIGVSVSSARKYATAACEL